MSQPPNNGPQGNPQQPYPHNDGQQYPQNNQYGYGQPPKKKRKKWPWVLGILVLLGILLFGGCAALMGGAMNAAEEATNDSTSSDSTPAAGGETKEAAGADIELAGTASGAASANYGPLGSASTADFEGSWSATVPELDGETYSVTIQDSSGAEDASVSCSVSEGGEVVEEQKATGAYSIATCSQPLF